MVKSVKYPCGKLSDEQLELVSRAELIISDQTFDWETTTQGHDYWDTVCVNLREIVERANVCESCGQKLPE